MSNVETKRHRAPPALAGKITEVRGIDGNRSGTRRGCIHRAVRDVGRASQPLEEEPLQGINGSLIGPIQGLGSKEAARTASAPRRLAKIIDDFTLDRGFFGDSRRQEAD